LQGEVAGLKQQVASFEEAVLRYEQEKKAFAEGGRGRVCGRRLVSVRMIPHALLA
jgi:hypothetical protein